MSQIPIRRAQLITPFGVGAMLTGQDGTSMITAALDAWFTGEAASSGQLDMDEYRVDEWRLQEALRVKEFRLPPDYRSFGGHGERPKNLLLKVPLLRFPLWHFCRRCRALHELSSHHGNRRRCPSCESSINADGKKTRAPFLAQVPFVAMCARGHIQDFPWREWVHRDASPSCHGQLRLRATGMASLASQKVECECGVEPRTLAGITEAFPAEGQEDTVLSSTLMPGGRFDCRGQRPWMDDRSGEGCGMPLRGSLRAATNVYYAHIESAIYLPGTTADVPEDLVELLENPPLNDAIKYTTDLLGECTPAALLKSPHASLLDRFTEDQIATALEALEQNKKDATEAAAPDDEVDPERLRRPEHDVLLSPMQTGDLQIRPQDPALYSGVAHSCFRTLNLVDRLRETRALYGFSRVRPDGRRTLSDRKKMLWRTEPSFDRSWLPAYVVRGEGLFFELSPERLSKWEARADVRQRVAHLAAHPERVRASRGLEDPALMPRFLLLHTFAHLMINQLVFECGYSSASLRERLYCGIAGTPMAGVLIYTAAGDSEGTMGGLVRMGKPGNLEPVITAALDTASWCSSDPVCMEMSTKGQGPGGTNMAACHSCALVPETACECFNRFLDRGVVVGTREQPGLGFFS